MELDELNKLEEKVKSLVENSKKLRELREENENLKLELGQLKNESSLNIEERQEIKKKVSTLLQLIDSIES